jgi:hypothetical protein
VVQWPYFDNSKDNKTQLRELIRMLQGPDKRHLLLRVNRNPHSTWRSLEA